mgnify:CR=1 FL=1
MRSGSRSHPEVGLPDVVRAKKLFARARERDRRRSRRRSRGRTAQAARRTFCSTSRIVVPRRLTVATISMMLRTAIGARPSEGSSSRSRRGRAIRARPMASICCSPPESVPAACGDALLQAREEGEDLHRASRGARPRAAGGAGAHLEVLEDRQGREHLAALRNVRARPRATICRGVSPAERSTLEQDAAAAQRQQPGRWRAASSSCPRRWRRSGPRTRRGRPRARSSAPRAASP